MKTLLNLRAVCIYFTLLVLATSCGTDDSPLISTRLVTFGFSSTVVNGRVNSEITPTHARVSIVDSKGVKRHHEVLLGLFAFGDSYVSESIELEIGAYELTLFQILNEEGTVVMASPIEGSVKAEEVNQPLPIPFVVAESLTTNVIPEVLMIEADDTPADYGYVNFGFSLVTDFSLNLSVISDYDSAFVKSVISFRAYDKDSVAMNDWTHRYESGVEEAVGLDRSAHFYEVKVDASLHHSITYFFTTEYLRSLESLNLRLSPNDFTQKYQLNGTEIFHNELNLYLPQDGCIDYARLDATGMEFFYLHISSAYYEQETGISLLPPNSVEVFDSNDANLIYPTPSVASKADNICEIINQQHEDNPAFDVEIFVLMDDGKEFSFAAYAWDSTTGIWNEMEE